VLHFSKLKIFFIIITVTIGFLFCIPNILNKNNNFFLNKKVILGLDLQGGSYLLLEVDTKSLVKEKLEIKSFELKKQLRDKRILYNNFKLKNDNIFFTSKDNYEKAILEILNSDKFNEKTNISIKSGKFGERGTLVTQIIFKKNGNNYILNFSNEYIDNLKSQAIEQSLEVIRSRIDELGTREPNIVSQGKERILVELPGIKNPSKIKNLIGKTAKLTFKFIANSDADKNSFDILKSRNNLENYNIEKKLILSGEHLTDAQPGFDNINNTSVVNFKLDNFGSKKFAYITKNNIGRRLAIIIDNEVISAPVIKDSISSGSGQISGSFSVQEANDLAIVLRSGALPVPMSIIEERTVGPDLGKESVKKGLISLIIGFLLVVLYIFMNYKIFGLFANLSLFVNLILLVGALTLLEATLTLPGIAGIILTVGMAVDANVLIYERIKEELKIETNTIIAFDNGYKRVLTTLLDANITTLIAAFVLYFIGSGPVKGFAVTLAIGIITSLFTTFVLGRLFVALYVKSKKGEVITI